MAFYQASGVAAYCMAIGIFLSQAGKLFGAPGMLAPVLILTLLSFSVLVCGLLVFYKPYKLFFDAKKKEAADLVVATTFWLFFYFILFLIITWVMRR